MTRLRPTWRSKRFRLPFALYRIQGASMQPALKPGSIVVARQTRTATVGDIVVFQHDRLDKIKRIAGLGDMGFFVLGDNLAASTDSRHFGPITREAIKGRIVWPRA